MRDDSQETSCARRIAVGSSSRLHGLSIQIELSIAVRSGHYFLFVLCCFLLDFCEYFARAREISLWPEYIRFQNGCIMLHAMQKLDLRTCAHLHIHIGSVVCTCTQFKVYLGKPVGVCSALHHGIGAHRMKSRIVNGLPSKSLTAAHLICKQPGTFIPRKWVKDFEFNSQIHLIWLRARVPIQTQTHSQTLTIHRARIIIGREKRKQSSA